MTDAASATTTPAPATQPPDGSGAIVVVPSGNYTGECVVVAHSDNLGDEPRQTIHWRFTVLNDDRVKLFSANSGYAIVLARTADATFLGSGVLPGQNGWRQMLKLVVTASDDKGTATKLDAVVMDRLSGAPQPTWVRAICKMAARAE